MQLLREDSTTLLTTLSDSSGQYTFPATGHQHYILRATATGYKPGKALAITTGSDTIYSVPDMVLEQDAQQLTAVTITAAKPLFEMKPDKLVMNVENNPVAAGNSVFQVVRQAPGVNTDKDDNLLLKGAGAQIYINGKPAFLTGTQLTEYLKNLPADQVATIEIITQPSGKYDAAGTAGIINIKLKKNKAYGLNGVATLGGGVGRYPKINGGLNLNYRKGKVNVFGNIAPGYSESYNKLNYNSTITGAGTIYQDRENYWHPKTTWLPYSIGTDYYISDKSVLGVLISGEYCKANAVTDNVSVFRDAGLQPYQYINSQRRDNSSYNNTSYNVNYKSTLDSAGSELMINADYGRYTRQGTDVNENVFLDAAYNRFRPDYTFRLTQPATITLSALTADYSHPVSVKGKIELGGKYSYVHSDNNLLVDSIAHNNWVHDANRSNRFIYKEQIAAGYITWSQEWGKTSLQVGLRGEYTKGSGNSPTLNQVNKINYFSLFPTLYLSRVLDSNNSINLSYGRRISRPSYQSLNPFMYYLDPYTMFEGNPYLKPSYAHSVELKHSYKQLLFTTLSYRYSKGDAIQTILQEAGTGRVTNRGQNAGTTNYLRLDVFIQLQPTSWWTMENSLGLAASRSTSQVPGYSYDTRALSADIYTNHSFTLPHEIKLQTSLYYSAPTRDGLARLQSGYGWGLGAQKQLWHQRATIKINMNNIIATNAYRAHYLGEGLDIRWRNEWEGRKLSISFDYRFGSQQIKAARERRLSSEEKSRIGI